MKADLARAVGVNRSTVGDWLQNGMIPSRGHQGLLARALGLEPRSLHEKATEAGRGRTGISGRRRAPVSFEEAGLHPALAEALVVLDWEGQAALAQVLRMASETKRQEFRDGEGLTWSVGRAENDTNIRATRRDKELGESDDDAREQRLVRSRAGWDAESRGEEPYWTTGPAGDEGEGERAAPKRADRTRGTRGS